MRQRQETNNLRRATNNLPPRPSFPDQMRLRFLWREHGGAMTKVHAIYGPVVDIGPYILLVGADAQRFLLQSSDDFQTGPLVEPEPRGLRGLDGEPLLQQRKLVQCAFDKANLSGYGRIMKRLCEDRAATWNTRVNVYHEASAMVVETLFATMLGLAQGPLYTEVVARYWDLTNQDEAWRQLPLIRQRYATRAQERLWTALRPILAARRAEPGPDAISALIAARDDQTGAQLSEYQIFDHLFTLLEAGREASIVFLSCALTMLAARPDLQKRLRDEHQHQGVELPLSLDRLHSLPVTMNFLREVERLYPPVPAIVRSVVKEATFGGYRIPTGRQLLASLYLTQRDPRLFADPLRFDPDRFAAPRQEHKTPFALLGFGAGPHRCIGKGFALLQTATLLHALLPHYDLRLEGEPGQPQVKYWGGFAAFGRRTWLKVARH